MHHHKSGNLAQAESMYRQALEREPENPDALYFLGAIAYQTGKYVAAEEHLRRAIRIHAGAPAYHNGLGLVLQGLGRFEEAISCYEAALKINPKFVEAYSNLGNAFRLQGRLADAAAAYQQALSVQPRLADAHCGLGMVYALQENRGKEARACFDRALALNPMHVDAHNGLGLLSVQEGNRSEAEQRFRRALGLNPDFAEAHNNLGRVLASSGKPEEAEGRYRHAIRLNPGRPEFHVNLGVVLSEQGKFDEAFSEYETALRLVPDSAQALQYKGIDLEKLGRLEEALSCYQRALSLTPGDNWLQLKIATLLPAIPQFTEEMLHWRRRFEAEVARLVRDGIVLKDAPEKLNLTKFYLSYHGLCNREIHSQVARMYEMACPSLLWTAPHCRDWRPSERIRVGFVSKFMYAHSIGRTTRGLVAKLSRDRFETCTLFVPPFKDDSISQFIRNNSDHSLVLPDTVEGARQAIADLKLDVLFYQDIGMEPFTYYLAFARLAPVQCLSFGHPDTTGISNMDYFVSNDLFELPDAAEHYSEKLFLLRNLGTLAYYYRPATPTVMKRRGDFKLPDNSHIYLCPQTLFKFHPDFDAILGGILRADPSGLLVLMEGGSQQKHYWPRLLMARFNRTFPDVANRVVFLPNQNGDDFLNVIAISDVMLDTIHFSGMNTSLEAFAMGTPVVTFPGTFQCARHVLGMYTRMGITDCIARNADEYVEIAIRLGTDKAYRDEISAKILANNGVLYEDINVVREFERFFIEAVAQAGRRQTEN